MSSNPPNLRIQLEPKKAGSLNCPFKLAIIGGGPAGSSILVRATRFGLLSELCGFSYESISIDPNIKESVPSSAGICLFEGGSVERFGGGRLQDYVINSNTFINKFVTNVVDEKPDNLPPEKVRGTQLEKLIHYQSSIELQKIGSKTGPLDSVGHFLRDVGQIVLSSIAQYPESSRCLTETFVQSLHQILDDDGKFLCWKIVFKVSGPHAATTTTTENAASSPSSASSSSSSSSYPPIQEYYAKHVVLATGGHQALPVVTNPAYKAKLMTSDVVCTQEGIVELRQRLLTSPKTAANSSTGMGKVVIIGGSHSAFSAAWICLNKLVEEESIPISIPVPNNNANTNNNPLTSPGKPANNNNTTSNNRIKIGNSGICILYRSPMKVFYATKAEADHDSYAEAVLYMNRTTGQINPFGGIRGDAKELWRAIRSNREPRIRLLQIKTNNIGLSSNPLPTITTAATTAAATVPATTSAIGAVVSNTSTSTEATTTAAAVISTNTAANNNTSNSNSNASSFGGMKQSIVDKILEESSVIIWACGYSTNTIPVYDATGKIISMSTSKGQYNVDDQARILANSHWINPIATTVKDQANIVPNLYGNGLGYGFKAMLENGELDGASGRADGVAVYLKRGATLVLGHVLGRVVYGNLPNVSTWEERNAYLKKYQKTLHKTSSSTDSLTISVNDDSDESPPPSPKKLMKSPPHRPSTSSSNNNQHQTTTVTNKSSITHTHTNSLYRSPTKSKPVLVVMKPHETNITLPVSTSASSGPPPRSVSTTRPTTQMSSRTSLDSNANNTTRQVQRRPVSAGRSNPYTNTNNSTANTPAMGNSSKRNNPSPSPMNIAANKFKAQMTATIQQSISHPAATTTATTNTTNDLKLMTSSCPTSLISAVTSSQKSSPNNAKNTTSNSTNSTAPNTPLRQPNSNNALVSMSTPNSASRRAHTPHKTASSTSTPRATNVQHNTIPTNVVGTKGSTNGGKKTIKPLVALLPVAQ